MCFLNACLLADVSRFRCLAHAIADKGAEAVIARTGSIETFISSYFDARVWQHMTKDGWGASHACAEACQECEAHYTSAVFWLAGGCPWAVWPPGTNSPTGNDTVIWPADLG